MLNPEKNSEDVVSPPVAGRRREWAALLLLMAVYSVLFATYYPPLAGIEDEIGFINQALVWSRGAITAEGAGYERVPDFLPSHLGSVSRRHPGRSLLILPFLALGGDRAIFVSGLLVHLVTTLLAAATLDRLGRSPLWAVLVLLHPTLAIYSRTVLADEAAGAGLLGAALALTYPGLAGAVGAGLAVGVAALMRYQAGLALPLAALACRFPAGRARPWRDALACLLAGGLVGALIAVYNLILYQHPIQPPNYSYGFFSLRFLTGDRQTESYALFYASALMVVWPGMLLAPALDRTRLRWLNRSACAAFFLFFSLYYWHDKASGRVATWIVGLRLLQVALPLWTLSYATVLDDWVAEPLRRRLGARSWRGLATVACAVMLLLNAAMFHKHQEHLQQLRSAGDSLVATVPQGAFVLNFGPLRKVFTDPESTSYYRWRRLTEVHGYVFDYTDEIRREDQPWYIAGLPFEPGQPLPEAVTDLVARYHMTRVPTGDPHLVIYVGPPRGVSHDDAP